MMADGMDNGLAENLGLTLDEAKQLGLLHPAMMASPVEPVVVDDEGDGDVVADPVNTQSLRNTPAWQSWGTGASGEGTGGAAYVFLCNNRTQSECAAWGLLAAPYRELEKMKRCIGPRTQLFLHNFESRMVLGPFTARRAPDLNLEPEAFAGRFSAQVAVAPHKALREATLTYRVPSGPKRVPELRDLRAALKRGRFAGQATQAAWKAPVQEPDLQAPAEQPGDRLPAEDAWEAVVVSDDELEVTMEMVPTTSRGVKRRRTSDQSTGRGPADETPAKAAKFEDPYPRLSQFYMRHRLQNGAKAHTRYFGGGLECSDDGHPTRWASWNMCYVCLEMTHEMRDCPVVLSMRRNIASCKRELQEELPTILMEALVAVSDETPSGERPEVRCLWCGAVGAGHLNCREAPAAAPFRQVSGRPAQALRHRLSVQAAELRSRRAPKPANAEGPEDFLPVTDAPDVEEVQDIASDDESAILSSFMSTPAERGAAFACWASTCVDNEDLTTDVAAAAAGLPLASKPPGVESAVLRLLAEGSIAPSTAVYETPWKRALAAAPGPLLGRAVHNLWRIGAIAASAATGEQPELTSVGWWSAALALPPSVSCALLHGAQLGVLLPIAVLTVLLESTPPDVPLGVASVPAPRKSEHYGLVAVFFRWLEGRQVESTFRFGSDLFWETVHSRVIAVMKYAQSLGYNGDDAAFEEMDGEVMETRALHARPWTLAAALGNEGSERWARIRACLAAAFPPDQSGVVSKVWASTTAARDGTPRLSTKLSSSHALLFAAGELRQAQGATGSVAEVGGVRGTIFGGDGAFEEAFALRTEYSERVAQAVQALDAGHTGALQVMDDSFVLQMLEFLRGSAGEFVCTADDGDASALIRAEHSGLCHRVLDLLGRGDEQCQGLGLAEVMQEPALSRVTAASSSSSSPSGACTGGRPSKRVCGGSQEATGGPSLATRDEPAGLGAGPPKVIKVADTALVAVQVCDEWVAALASTTLLRYLQRHADAARDKPFAAAVKKQLGVAQASLATCRDRAACETMTRAAAVAERLARQKQQAVLAEDYPRAQHLKQRLGELQVQALPPAPGELERVAAEKMAAAFNEDYARAAELKAEQEALEAAWCRFEVAVADQAADLAGDSERRAVLHGADLAGQQALLATEEEVWADVVAQLRVLATGACHTLQ